MKLKRVMMQLFRSAVTVVVVGTMAVMIFSLRAEVAEAKAKARAAADAGPGLFETIHARTSVRKFDPSRPVSDAAVETILKAAMCAPSAMDRRPWEFVVVRDRAQLDALAQRLPNSRVGNGAQLAIVVCGTTDNGLPGRGKEYWIHDCSAASMNILLAAKGLGLGAVWTGVYPGEARIAAVKEVLKIPQGYLPLNIIPIGYPAEDPAPKDKWNPAKVHRDRW